ncbi:MULTISPECIES: PilN domain-containing protein [unclassified Nitrosomonas]|uniref:PilN domain-containing protein n=1 Tax=unclassified Nitrosomonas TaxID=2609265 RepID=UPI0008856A04|nr:MULTISPECIES: PilN domain-containing protein [unclassified Nitrosomonas]SDH18673.1 Fimbrial assembly protein (PilN) [Nitrosomonas sp. Nm132]SDY03786.1 Fimbrial assembly protein (PilN) [Nitrosomonas sp. Nm58]
MRSLKLRFPYAGQQARSIDYILLGIGCLVFVVCFYQLRLIMEEIAHWDARIHRLEQQQQHKKTPRAPIARITQETQQELKQAREILRQINLPWEALFDSLEYAVSKEIALLSVQPNVANRTIRISGEARNLVALTDFVEAMEREDVFENAHLLNYKVKQENPYRPIAFSLTTTWIDLP